MSIIKSLGCPVGPNPVEWTPEEHERLCKVMSEIFSLKENPVEELFDAVNEAIELLQRIQGLAVSPYYDEQPPENQEIESLAIAASSLLRSAIAKCSTTK